MIIRCPKCHTDFALEAEPIGPEGVTLRCSVCSHVFHAELARPEAASAREPWQVANPEKHLFTVPDVRALLQQIEEGKITPDFTISRTGEAWIKLRELPEFSNVFAAHGANPDLPRVFRAIDPEPTASGLPPPPPLGGEEPDLLGPPPEFGATMGGPPRPHEEAARLLLKPGGLRLDSGPLPAPPAHGTAAKTPIRRPASMLEAVTHAVAGPADRDVDAPDPDESARMSSQPIVLDDVKAAADAGKAARDDEPAPRERERSPESEVVILKVDKGDADESSATVWYILFGLAVGVVVLLLVPDLRERVLNLGRPPEPQTPQQVVDMQPEILGARKAIHNLGLKETDTARRVLQNVIDSSPVEARVEQARLAQAELLASRAVVFTIALALDRAAVEGTAQSEARESADWAQQMLDGVGRQHITDLAQRPRVEGLLALAASKDQAEVMALLPPQGAEEVRLAAEASPLWQRPDAPVPAGLIGRMRTVPGPSTLTQSLLALALARSGDLDTANQVVQQILTLVPDQPLALTLRDWLAQQQQPGDRTPPSAGSSGAEVEVSESSGAEPTDAAPPSTSGGGTRPPSSGGGNIESRIDRACEQVQGDEPRSGIDALMALVGREGPYEIKANLCRASGYRKIGKDASALAFYERVLSVEPAHTVALRGAAETAAAMGKDDQAIGFYQRLLSVNPNDPKAIAFLAKHGVARPKPAQPTLKPTKKGAPGDDAPAPGEGDEADAP
ncbi:MAG: zinc-ribbon domain-containing protein [Myxococcales bacterium]|nr:zinc-ribbon domain-containing protein [Myxococcales bacterium]